MINKKIIALSVFFIFGLSILTIVSINNENNIDFDYCEDQPMFGLKYEFCPDMNCVNFHENIKNELKKDCGNKPLEVNN